MNFDRQLLRTQRIHQADPGDAFAKKRMELLKARRITRVGDTLSSHFAGQIGFQLELFAAQYLEFKKFQTAYQSIIQHLLSENRRRLRVLYRCQNEKREFVYIEDEQVHFFTLFLLSEDPTTLKSIMDELNSLGPYLHYWIGPKVVFGSTIEKSFETRSTVRRQTSCPGSYAEIAVKVDRRKSQLCTFEVGDDARHELMNRGRDLNGFIEGVRSILLEFIKFYGVQMAHFELTGGRKHIIDSRNRSFREATRQLVKANINKLTACPLEPLMSIEWRYPMEEREFVENVCLSDFEELFVVEDEGSMQRLQGRVRLASTFFWPLSAELRTELFLDFNSYVEARTDVDGFSLTAVQWRTLEDARWSLRY